MEFYVEELHFHKSNYDGLCKAVCEDWWDEWQKDYQNQNIHTMEDMQQFYVTNNYFKNYVVYKDNVYIGTFTIYLVSPWCVCLSNVYVRPLFRGNKLGHTLIHQAVAKVRQKYWWCTDIVLVTRQTLVSFYGKHGFRVVHIDAQKDQFIMIKEIPMNIICRLIGSVIPLHSTLRFLSKNIISRT